MLPAAAIKGMTRALEVMKEVVATGVPVDRPDLAVGIEDIVVVTGHRGAEVAAAALVVVGLDVFVWRPL